MDDKKTGGPAFSATGPVSNKGMTLRDYFAAHAPITLADAVSVLEHSNAPSCTIYETLAYLAKLRTDYADAMIAARAPRPDFSTEPVEFQQDVQRFMGGPTL